MNQKFNKVIAKLSAAALIGSMFVTASPALAAAPTLMKDTMSNVAGAHVHTPSATGVTHTISMTLPAGGITVGDDLVFHYGDAGFVNVAAVSAPVCGAGTSPTTGVTANNVTLTGVTTDCTGTLTFTFTADNTGLTPGSQLIDLDGTAGISGQYAVAISAGDQITVTASIEPSITFEVWAQTGACTTTPSGLYTVDLGVLAPGAVYSSDDQAGGSTTAGVDDKDGICVLLSTNAANGAIVTVKGNSDGADKGALASTSVPADMIGGAAADPGASSGYGICVDYVQNPTVDPAGVFNSTDFGAPITGTDGGADNNGTCDAGNWTGSTALSNVGTAQNIFTTTTEGVSQGLARILVKASVSGTQAAHTDYTATQTYVATGTF